MPTFVQAASAGLTFIDGLLAGMFIGSSLVEHAAASLTPSTWVAYKHAKEAVFAPVMPAVFITCLIATAAAAVVLPAHFPLSVAVGLMALTFAITATVHLPLNATFQTWTSTDYPVTWDAGRARWRHWNIIRTILVIIAYGLVLAARR